MKQNNQNMNQLYARGEEKSAKRLLIILKYLIIEATGGKQEEMKQTISKLAQIH